MIFADQLLGAIGTDRVLNLPRRIHGSLVIPPGLSNLQLIGHPQGTLWTNNGVCLSVIGGQNETLPPFVGDPYPLVEWGGPGEVEVDGLDLASPGDYVWIYPADGSLNPVTETNVVTRPIGGFMARVTGAVGTTLQFDPLQEGDPTEWTFLPGWAVAKLNINPVRHLRLSNIKFDARGAAACVAAYYVDGLVLEDLSARNAQSQGIYVVRSNHVEGARFHLQSIGVGTGSGYAMSVSGCKDVVIEDVYAERASRAVGADGSVYNVLFKGATGKWLSGSITDFHGGFGHTLIFEDCFPAIEDSVNDGSYGSTRHVVGNVSWRGLCLDIQYIRCRGREMTVNQNQDVAYTDCVFERLGFERNASSGSVFSRDAVVTINNANNLNVNWTPFVRGTLSDNTSLTIDGGSVNTGWSSKGLIGATDATDGGRWMNLNGKTMTLNVSNLAMFNGTNATPFCTFHGAGAVVPTMTNVTFTGGTGTRNVVSVASGSSINSASSAGVTVNGSSVNLSTAVAVRP